jgi:hypothetical protein
LRGVSKDRRERMWLSFEARRKRRRAPQDDGGDLGGEVNQSVMRGLDPRIHPSSQESFEEDGLPGQARQ